MRARRLASYALDLFFMASPWASFLGLALVRPNVGWMGGVGVALVVGGVASLATLVLATVEAVLFVRRGRTLGMAYTGLVVTRGSRAWALALDALLLVLPYGAVLVAWPFLQGDTVKIVRDTVKIVAPVSPFVGIVLNLLSALGPSGRTLVDRATGMLVARDAEPLGRYGFEAKAVDALLLLMVAAPIPLGDGAAVGSACALGVMVLLQVALLKVSGGTIGRRSLGQYLSLDPD